MWSFLSRCNPPREVRLDNHMSPSVIGSPPGSAFDKDNALALVSSNNKAMTTKKEKKKTAQEEEKMPAAGNKKKRHGRFETDSKSSNSTENLVRLHQFLVEKEDKKQEGSSAACGAKIPLWVEVPEEDGSSTSSSWERAKLRLQRRLDAKAKADEAYHRAGQRSTISGGETSC